MGNRLVREGLLDSDRYWSVTIEARQLFVHMLLLADDFGCISVSPTFLRRRCFNDSPSTERVAKLLNELQDVDLVRLYDVERACYAFIPRFRQRLQRSTLKHPSPPESLLEGDTHAQEMFRAINNKTQNPTVGQPLATRVAPLANTRSEEKRREVEEKRKTSMSGKPDVTNPNAWNFRDPPPAGMEAEYLLAFLNRVTSRRYQAVEANLKLIKARLRDSSVDEIKRVIANKANRWRDDPKMDEYLRPATLFNATKFAQYQGEIAA